MKSIHNNLTAVSYLLHHRKRLIFYIFLIITSFVIFSTTKDSYADTIDVTATVPAPLPTGPAVITSPLDGTVTTEQLITVEGTCPTNGAYVIISRNGIDAGVAPCTAGSFELVMHLVLGSNALQAAIYNITNNAGPLSTIVTVFYAPLPSPILPLPSVPTTPGLPSLPSSSILPSSPTGRAPFTLEYTYKYEVRIVGEKWTWNIFANGGFLPYTFTVDWGDGTRDTYGPTTSHTLEISHIYQKAGSFTPLIKGYDSAASTAALQLLAVVNPGEEIHQEALHQPEPFTLSTLILIAIPLIIVLCAAIIKEIIIRKRKE